MEQDWEEELNVIWQTLESKCSITDDGYKRKGRMRLHRIGPLFKQEAEGLRHKKI
jgi:hypothetical protein